MMKKKNMIICILAIGIFLLFISADFSKQTQLEFSINNSVEIGFERSITIYTESDVTKIPFSGKLTVDKTAEIIITKNESGDIVYNSTYSNLKAKPIQFEVDNLVPNSYYTLNFFSKDAKTGYLLLMTDKLLVKSPKGHIQSIKTDLM